MNPPLPLRAYMASLQPQLGKLDRADADEVLREIESHVHEVIELAETRGEAVDIAAVLEGFGPPETLAAQYVAHVQTGAPPPAGFRVIQRVRQTVTSGLYYSMGGFGYSVAAAFLLLALAKAFDPASVGVWSAAGGEAITVTWHGPPHPAANELLGHGLVPAALMAGLWCAWLTHRVLRVLKRGLR